MAKLKQLHIVRCDRSGVFHGEIVSRKGREVEMRNVRRLWYWSGAASLSELAVKGPGNPGGCKFPAVEPSKTLLDAIELLPTTASADKVIAAVPVWSSQ